MPVRPGLCGFRGLRDMSGMCGLLGYLLNHAPVAWQDAGCRAFGIGLWRMCGLCGACVACVAHVWPVWPVWHVWLMCGLRGPCVACVAHVWLVRRMCGLCGSSVACVGPVGPVWGMCCLCGLCRLACVHVWPVWLVWSFSKPHPGEMARCRNGVVGIGSWVLCLGFELWVMGAGCLCVLWVGCWVMGDGRWVSGCLCVRRVWRCWCFGCFGF
jgi:hypothetical protein